MLRRKFIAGSILAVGGATAGTYLYRSNVQSSLELAIGEIVSKLAVLPGAIEFGEKFREQLKKSGLPTKSLKTISSYLADVHGELHSGNIGYILEQQIQTELRTDKVHVINGWYLTRTELNLCALASIV
jgi:hypothetical protein